MFVHTSPLNTTVLMVLRILFAIFFTYAEIHRFVFFNRSGVFEILFMTNYGVFFTWLFFILSAQDRIFGAKYDDR